MEISTKELRARYVFNRDKTKTFHMLCMANDPVALCKFTESLPKDSLFVSVNPAAITDAEATHADNSEFWRLSPTSCGWISVSPDRKQVFFSWSNDAIFDRKG